VSAAWPSFPWPLRSHSRSVPFTYYNSCRLSIITCVCQAGPWRRPSQTTTSTVETLVPLPLPCSGAAIKQGRQTTINSETRRLTIDTLNCPHQQLNCYPVPPPSSSGDSTLHTPVDLTPDGRIADYWTIGSACL